MSSSTSIGASPHRLAIACALGFCALLSVAYVAIGVLFECDNRLPGWMRTNQVPPGKSAPG